MLNIQWYLDIRVPQHTSFSRYEPASEGFFCFELRANFEIRVRFSRSAGNSTRPCATRSRPSWSVNQLAASFRCDKLCSCSSFIFITMDRKKVCEKSSAKSIELKRKTIEKDEQGVRVVDLSRQYGRSTSMICTVLKHKESIKSVTPAKGLTIISKLRTSLHENMEKLLMVWVTEKQLQGDTLTQTIICEKARAIYGDLLKQTPQTSIDEASEESFKASRGWFENFKKRTGIHSVFRHVRQQAQI
ncbi:tigger transposable element-derived protein 1 [Nephila pilipes]|uniref:Tigger transposable element-derived protein 1 n=1 Tax=Nephila pilipes TaxID=299642 RepID=A0A8X6MWL5_NEPPI|nr:tigger transposable element-derived protein 1 [Nephila pilipes]